MYKTKQLISLILVLAMCLSLGTTAFATEISTAGSSAETPVILNVEAALFSVTIPTGLPVDVAADGTVTVATDAKIINNSHGPVQVVNMTIEAVEGWTIANYDEDLKNALVDSNQISMIINELKTTGSDAIEFSTDNFTVMLAKNDDTTDECSIVYNAKVTPLSEAFATDTVANLVFTVDWYKADGSTTETTSNPIPEGGTYTVAATSEVLEAGDAFPEAVADSDTYAYGDYLYTYSADAAGWKVGLNSAATDTAQTSYGEILSSVNGSPVNNMYMTFMNCTAMTESPEIPDSITSLYGTFYGCSALATVPELPAGLTDMSAAFAETAITEAPTIPSGVTSLWSTFENCTSLVTYEGSTDADGDFSGYVIPEGVTNMKSAFSYCSALTVAPEIPSTVTNMADTFRYCSALIEAPVIPEGVTSLQRTFDQCTNLKTYTGSTDTDGDFSGYVLPDGLTGNMSLFCTFQSCKLLTAAPAIPNGVVSLEATFQTCTALTVAPVIPSTVTKMENTFGGCTSLEGALTINSTPTVYDGCLRSTNITEILGDCDDTVKEAILATVTSS